MKVLILSITAGEGHNSTAAAIKDCFAAHGDTAEVFDAYRYVSKALYEIVKQGYLLVSKDFKTLFAKSYAMAENRRAGITVPCRIKAEGDRHIALRAACQRRLVQGDGAAPDFCCNGHD